VQLPVSQANATQLCTFVLPKSLADSVKNRKLLIPVRCTTRKFYLHPPPPGRNDWHVRFAPLAVDGVRRVVPRSTGTKEIPAAIRIGAQMDRSRRKRRGASARVHL